MAQLVEHILGKDEVISSNLISSSNPTFWSGFWFVQKNYFLGHQTARRYRRAVWLYFYFKVLGKLCIGFGL